MRLGTRGGDVRREAVIVTIALGGVAVAVVSLIALSSAKPPPRRAAPNAAAPGLAPTTAPIPAPGVSGTAPPPLTDEPALPPAPQPDAIEAPTGTLAEIISRVPTSQPVVFVTIDDGWVRDPRVVQLLQSARVSLCRCFSST